MRETVALLWYRILRFGFQVLYNELAWTYDAVSWLVSLGQWRDWQRTGVSYLRGRCVLELAHGPGHMLVEMSQAGYQVVGFDLSPHMGRMARRRMAAAGMSIPLVTGRAQALPFPGNTFDSVLATFPTEFIVQPATSAAVFRVLRPGGRLVMVPEARLTGWGPLRRFIDWLFAITGQRVGPDGAGHLSRYWKMAEKSYRTAGFELRVEQVVLAGSVVTIALAHKPSLKLQSDTVQISEKDNGSV